MEMQKLTSKSSMRGWKAVWPFLVRNVEHKAELVFQEESSLLESQRTNLTEIQVMKDYYRQQEHQKSNVQDQKYHIKWEIMSYRMHIAGSTSDHLVHITFNRILLRKISINQSVLVRQLMFENFHQAKNNDKALLRKLKITNMKDMEEAH